VKMGHTGTNVALCDPCAESLARACTAPMLCPQCVEEKGAEIPVQPCGH